jgi:hypothetical protein
MYHVLITKRQGYEDNQSKSNMYRKWIKGILEFPELCEMGANKNYSDLCLSVGLRKLKTNLQGKIFEKLWKTEDTKYSLLKQMTIYEQILVDLPGMLRAHIDLVCLLNKTYSGKLGSWEAKARTIGDCIRENGGQELEACWSNFVGVWNEKILGLVENFPDL